MRLSNGDYMYVGCSVSKAERILLQRIPRYPPTNYKPGIFNEYGTRGKCPSLYISAPSTLTPFALTLPKACFILPALHPQLNKNLLFSCPHPLRIRNPHRFRIQSQHAILSKCLSLFQIVLTFCVINYSDPFIKIKQNN